MCRLWDSGEYWNRERYLDLIGGSQFAEAHGVLRDQMFPLVDGVDQALDQLHQEGGKQLVLSGEQARGTVPGSQWTTNILIGVSLLVTCGVLLMTRRSTRGLWRVSAELIEGAEQVARAAGQELCHSAPVRRIRFKPQIGRLRRTGSFRAWRRQRCFSEGRAVQGIPGSLPGRLAAKGAEIARRDQRQSLPLFIDCLPA